ncbi:putative RNA 3'-terminal phosphate cyclase-like protein [Apostichopus japonicus]|uniref:Putative RNA 3'-terminal phosphate cyclase-like protein n=1 Tax=Stichopus japonicus TaxID=307972 RepID=A0A2G8JDX9_STIJA|nr:putative RNA 3'-terminal phosphate cyclase-like protein [Apostichopus japonicus]
MEEIYRGGCVDSRHQGLALLFMALGQNDVSKLQTGPLSPYTIQFLRHMKDFLQIMFKIERAAGTGR